VATRSITRLATLAAAAVAMAFGFAGAQQSPEQPLAARLSADQPPPNFTPEQLEQLTGSIALYPDPLVAQILPASTYPIDVVKAARMVRSGVTDDQIEQQDWDPSVKAVAHYPSVIQLMDDNLDWTPQLGQAFMAQPDDVMQAIQRLRAKAQNLGNLATTPQEQVVAEDQAIRILPASPDVVYVPVYDPTVVYYEAPPAYYPWVTFGYGFPCGTWLDLDCDWFHHWGGWCYRPGWTWNHWRENVVVEGGRITRVRRDFQPSRADIAHIRNDPHVWHRDPARPQTFPGRRMSRPSDFDHFRGRDTTAPRQPAAAGPTGPARIDRGRAQSPEPRQPNQIFTPQPGNQTQRNAQRGEASRRGPQAPAGTPAPKTGPAAKPTPAPASGPVRAIPTPPPRAPAKAPPAKVTPAPVKIAPPPPAASRPAPTYTAPPRGGGGGSAPPRDGGGGGGGGNQREKNK